MTTIEEALAHAERHDDPLDYIESVAAVARRVDEMRSSVARAKCIAAARASHCGATHRQIAERCGVSPGMVQQWVKRGREYIKMDAPF